MIDEPTLEELETTMSVLTWLYTEEDNGLLRDHISIVRSALDSIITAREAL